MPLHSTRGPMASFLGVLTSSRVSLVQVRKLEPQGVVAFHQADVGEYLRDEETLC